MTMTTHAMTMVMTKTMTKTMTKILVAISLPFGHEVVAIWFCFHPFLRLAFLRHGAKGTTNYSRKGRACWPRIMPSGMQL
jgi:hypothetical protein